MRRVRRWPMKPTPVSTAPNAIVSSHGAGLAGGCGAVPPKPVLAPPHGIGSRLQSGRSGAVQNDARGRCPTMIVLSHGRPPTRRAAPRLTGASRAHNPPASTEMTD
jgi:hypothetical protein